MSRAYLHCLNHVQRPRMMDQASIVPGSRMSAPWILRSRRGLPQFNHTTLRPCQACKCCAVWNWRERPLQAKTAAFLDATARHSPPPKSGDGVSGRTAFCRPPLSPTPQACWREAGTETVPPFFPMQPMPP